MHQAGKYLRDQVALKKVELSDRPLAKQIRLGRKPPWKFREHLKSDWTESECLVAGSWMLECASTLDYFDVDDRGLPAIAPDWQQYSTTRTADVARSGIRTTPQAAV